MNDKQTLYDILGVSRQATPEELKSAFRRLAHAHHPDRTESDEDRSFVELTDAYRILSDPKRRRMYDRQFDPTQTVQGFYARNEDAIRVSETERGHGSKASVNGSLCCLTVPVPAHILENGGLVSVTIPEHSGMPSRHICLRVLPGEPCARIKHLGKPGVNGGEAGDLVLIPVSE